MSRTNALADASPTPVQSSPQATPFAPHNATRIEDIMPHELSPEVVGSDNEIAGATTDMRMVMAVIQPFRLDAVTMALEQLPGFGGMTVSDCRGFGRAGHGGDAQATRGRDPHIPGAEAGDRGVTDFTTKVRLEAVVNGAGLTRLVIDTIVRVAHTGRAGDGKVFSWPVAHAVRVRTSETNANAL